MSTRQLSLFYPIVEPKYVPCMTVEERFESFHAANPHVARRLAEMAVSLKRQGVKRYGMKALFEVLRYDAAMNTHGEPFKLNNNYTPYYARLLMDKMPGLRGFFETRKRVAR